MKANKNVNILKINCSLSFEVMEDILWVLANPFDGNPIKSLPDDLEQMQEQLDKEIEMMQESNKEFLKKEKEVDDFYDLILDVVRKELELETSDTFKFIKHNESVEDERSRILFVSGDSKTLVFSIDADDYGCVIIIQGEMATEEVFKTLQEKVYALELKNKKFLRFGFELIDDEPEDKEKTFLEYDLKVSKKTYDWLKENIQKLYDKYSTLQDYVGDIDSVLPKIIPLSPKDLLG